MCIELPDFDKLKLDLITKYSQINLQLSNGKRYNRGLLVLVYLKLRLMLSLSHYKVDKEKKHNFMFDEIDYLITLTNLIQISNGEELVLPNRVVDVLNYFKLLENGKIPQYALDLIQQVASNYGYTIQIINPFPNSFPSKT